ncbi:trypsin-1-like [Aphidius gifuensis]|uniref:trypsin-1-like n=1 Tax=Aphidius gifuensis TaxID=684658 RepID=UPI001CDD7FAE|nr:trypsin-1-like [Aphidius gifuensis]
MLQLLIVGAAIALICHGEPLRTKLNGSNGRVVGGYSTTIEKIPYQVSLQAYGSHNCGGSIISKNWIITAGHCSGGPPITYKIRAGSTYHNKNGTLHTVDKVIRHENYGSDRYGHPLNDIALMHVKEPFVLDKTRQIINLFNLGEESPANALSIISGWGNTGNTYPAQLQIVQVPIITKRDCNNDYSSSGGIPVNQICAAYDEGGKDACQGDSGGPLAIDGRLAGITSWGRGCALAGNPGVYRFNMLKFVVSIVVAIVIASANAYPFYSPINPFTPNGRIVGGKPVDIQDAPHQVSLQNYGFGFCGGTIIGSQWVLTAAHCAVYTASQITVRAGSTTKGSGGSVHTVSKVIKHEKYKTNMYGVPINDVALLKINEPFTFDETRQAIELFSFKEEIVEGIHSVITGWGAVFEGGATTEVLNTVSVPIVSKEACDKAYSVYGGLPDGQICAAHPDGGKDACQGDSGGPLTVDGRLAGIVSWGNGCARPRYPGVYTEVAYFRDWIQEKTGF